MTLLVEALSPNVGQLVLRLDVVNGCHVVLDQLLDKKVPQHDVLCRRGVGVIAGHMARRSVVHLERNTVESFLES